MKQKLLLVALCALGMARAQQPTLVNLSQAPVVLHPSMAGSTGKHRTTVVTGVDNDSLGKGASPQGNIYDTRYFSKNYVNLSYDQMWKKIGTGVGGYVNYTYIPTQSGARYPHMVPYTHFEYRKLNLGLSFAPKYTVVKPGQPDQVRYTWSPSLHLAYNQAHEVRNVDAPDYNTNIYPALVRDLRKKLQHAFITELGGMVNSRQLLLGATLGYVLLHDARAYTWHYESYANRSYHHRIHASVLFGLSFPKRENSFMGISGTSKFTLARTFDKDYSHYSNYTGSLYRNISLRVWRVLAGVADNAQFVDDFAANSYYLGYKAKNWKATVGIARYKRGFNYGELTFMYSF